MIERENKLPERLKTAMKMAGTSGSELAERTGLSNGAISSYIHGRFSPKQDSIYAMARELHVDPAWLMGADVPMFPQGSPENEEAEKVMEAYQPLFHPSKKRCV